jgi:hypothetical protein
MILKIVYGKINAGSSLAPWGRRDVAREYMSKT